MEAARRERSGWGRRHVHRLGPGGQRERARTQTAGSSLWLPPLLPPRLAARLTATRRDTFAIRMENGLTFTAPRARCIYGQRGKKSTSSGVLNVCWQTYIHLDNQGAKSTNLNKRSFHLSSFVMPLSYDSPAVSK